MKPAVFDCVLEGVVVIEGDIESEDVTNGVNVEKMVLICEFSPVIARIVPNFVFFPFLKVVGDSDMSMKTGSAFSSSGHTECSVWVMMGVEEGGCVMWWLVVLEMSPVNIDVWTEMDMVVFDCRSVGVPVSSRTAVGAKQRSPWPAAFHLLCSSHSPTTIPFP